MSSTTPNSQVLLPFFTESDTSIPNDNTQTPSVLPPVSSHGQPLLVYRRRQPQVQPPLATALPIDSMHPSDPEVTNLPSATVITSGSMHVSDSEISDLPSIMPAVRKSARISIPPDRMQNNARRVSNGHHAGEVKESADDLESCFGKVSQSSSVPKSSSGAPDPLFDARINGKGKPKFPFKKASSPSPGIRKTSTTNALGDLSSIFGDATLSGEFEEIEGESEVRRRARWDRHQRTRDRMEQAVAHMNQRDLQTLHEQEERRVIIGLFAPYAQCKDACGASFGVEDERIAEKMDVRIKHWAAGKEGNMRALLSS
ncbi:hypothetical protein DKX38_008129 [Salix brachista]|uniref:Uncharacterized protein n=1 Tax=Salix brachista TaxID=2182728 RepID=A0A5N5MPX8_9ROSI|nr:hypothetical protein DKX38_008129 [Salix brachista]